MNTLQNRHEIYNFTLNVSSTAAMVQYLQFGITSVNSFLPRAYPRFKKWGTNHGEREERCAEGMRCGDVVSPPHWGGGYAPKFKEGLFQRSKVKVTGHKKHCRWLRIGLHYFHASAAAAARHEPRATDRSPVFPCVEFYGDAASGTKHCRRGSLHSCDCWLLLV